jgi:hypothetical protein
MARSVRCLLALTILLGACGRAPQPTPLDELAAKPEEVRTQVEDTQREHIEALKRQEAEATGGDAEPRR